ncbi:hypothetical protein PIB30_085553 [Stylosanthes scabra]|uniref:Uncharacterized protein n=1 Tax=Stylosanthes scabra TaxID=79078 RepID=A0ABU6USB5_9FABA|nr:hypothetical protein [Stylosanthes scabra]
MLPSTEDLRYWACIGNSDQGTHDTPTHDRNSFNVINLVSFLLSDHNTHTQLQPPYHQQPKSAHALARWENDPSPVLEKGNSELTVFTTPRTALSAAQIPRELPLIYRWVSANVLRSPTILKQAYLDELKNSGVLFGGRDLERQYRVEAAKRGERVCFLNLDHPIVPHWLWVNKVMFTEFGVRIPFTDFQQRILNRACVAPSQLHPNAWSSILCFELVIEFLELPQEPEAFLCLFKFYFANTAGKTKKGYMSVRPTSKKKIFAWRVMVGSLRTGATKRASKDVVDILTFLFAENNLAPKVLLGDREEARKKIVEMAGKDVTLARLCDLVHRPALFSAIPMTSVAIPNISGPSSVGRVQQGPEGSDAGGRGTPERGSSTGAGPDQLLDVSSPPPFVLTILLLLLLRPRNASGLRLRLPGRRVDGGSRELSPMDRSFDASGFIASNLLGLKAQEALRDYDPVESLWWAQWAMLRSATIMKSVEPRLTMMEKAERQNLKLSGDLKLLDLWRVVLEEEKSEAVAENKKAEENLAKDKKDLEDLRKNKDEEVGKLIRQIDDLAAEVEKLRGQHADEKKRADRPESSMSEL